MEKKKAKLTDKDMKPENISANITVRMNLDLLSSYKEWAEELGVGYQTLMKMKLTEALKGKYIEERLSLLEDKFKKQA